MAWDGSGDEDYEDDGDDDDADNNVVMLFDIFEPTLIFFNQPQNALFYPALNNNNTQSNTSTTPNLTQINPNKPKFNPTKHTQSYPTTSYSTQPNPKPTQPYPTPIPTKHTYYRVTKFLKTAKNTDLNFRKERAIWW